MGGNIDVDSVYGEGATFQFYITAVAAEPATGEQQPHSPRSSRRTKILSLKPSSSKTTSTSSFLAPTSQTAYHILITEDNIINQTVLNRQLKQAGFTTALASNGEQAIEEIKKLAKGNDVSENVPRRFDVILVRSY